MAQSLVPNGRKGNEGTLNGFLWCSGLSLAFFGAKYSMPSALPCCLISSINSGAK